MYSCARFTCLLVYFCESAAVCVSIRITRVVLDRQACHTDVDIASTIEGFGAKTGLVTLCFPQE
jgi:hypothetical protein